MRRDDAIRIKAVERAGEVGAAQAARELGLNANTVRSWYSRSFKAPVERKPAPKPDYAAAVAQTATATATKLVTVAERKAELAQKLADAAVRMADELFAATEEKKVAVAGQMREPKIVTIKRTTTTPAERKTTLEAIAKAVETVQLLTGEATERIEQIGGGSAVEAAKALLADVRERHLKSVS